MENTKKEIDLSAGRRVRGKVVRWSKHGYGFISSKELSREIWCHARSIVDSGIDVRQPLAIGMELEFEPRMIEGGRIEAYGVTRASVSPTPLRPMVTAVPRRIAGPERLTVVEPLVPSGASDRPPEPEPSDHSGLLEGAVDRGLAARVAAEKERIASERTRLLAERDRKLRDADACDTEVQDVVRYFDDKISELQRERDRQLAELRRDSEQRRLDAETLRTRCDSLPSVSAKSIALLEEDLRRAHAIMADWLSLRARARDDVERARAAAAAASGDEPVREYEEIRRRRTMAAEGIERKAYALAEQQARSLLHDYPDFLDRLDEIPACPLGLVVLAPEDPDGRLVLVIPVVQQDFERDNISWRVAAFLFDTAERAAKEMGATVTVGVISGFLAVDLRPWSVEPELVDVAAQDAWNARPSLAAASITLSRELVPGLDPPFDPLESAQDASTTPGPAMGGDLRSVAHRLGLTLADLIASLCASGLPFPDDEIDAGVEESLRALLRVGVEDGSHQERVVERTTPSDSVHNRSSPPMIARRLLAKLLRGACVGGRHMVVDNVWGHGFADDEKDVARELTRRLLRCGILVSRSKPGGDQVSIDPRRIDEAHRIIDLRWTEPSLFEGLE